MLQFLSLLCLLFFGAPLLPDDGETDWLSSSHPRITLKVGHDVEGQCVVDCTRYLFIVNYRGSNRASSEELIEWNSIHETGCIDIIVPGKTSFACKQASSLAGTAKNGQHYAILRFRLQRDQAASLTASAAVLRLRDVTFRFSDAGRTALAEFLEIPAAPTSD